MNLGRLEVICDSPPLKIVEACARLSDLLLPMDRPWHHFRRNTGRQACQYCRRAPLLQQYDIEYTTGRTISYFIGQCRHCGAIYWLPKEETGKTS